MKIALATNNADKIVEIKALLADLPLEILTSKDFPGFPNVEETADTLAGNALLKAKTIREFTGLPALADDTGLEVEALGGAPGVYSARYAGENATYESNCRHLLAEMKNIPQSERVARFRCVIAIDWGAETDYVSGVVEGLITTEPSGDNGFGYDPVFYYPPLGKTMGEMSPVEKNSISHRSAALAKARELIGKRLVSAE